MSAALVQRLALLAFAGEGPFGAPLLNQVQSETGYSKSQNLSIHWRINATPTSPFSGFEFPSKLQTKLDEIASWDAGWDGEDAEQISPHAIQSTKELLTHLLQEQISLREPAIVPTFDGAVQLEWHDRDRSLEFSFTGKKWVALGVELTEGQAPSRYVTSILGPDDYPRAAKCYEWFVRRDPRRAAWPLR